MPAPITPVSMPAFVDGVTRAIQSPTDAKGSSEFRGVLEGAIQKVEDTSNQATKAVEGFLNGDGQELHSAILATQRADLAFELGLQIRNKVISAYQEVMRIQM